MRRGLAAVAALPVAAVVALGVSSCSGDDLTQLVVVVDSDMRVPDELDAVRIEIVTSDGTTHASSGQLTGPLGSPLPRTLGVVHDGGKLGPIEVTAVGRHGGSDVIERRARVFFVEGETKVLTLFLHGACLGVDCPDGETCEAGSCRSVDVDPGELTDWTGEVPRRDGGPEDAGPVDGGPVDGGPVDGGPVDGGPVDAGPVDGGPPPDGCMPATEECNGADDDCDGSVDEDFDLDTDPMHCGDCGTACPTGDHATASCMGGSCGLVCDSGFDDCNADPADGCEAPLTSLDDCGSCGTRCRRAHARQTCDTGTCTIESCRSGWGDCNGMDMDGCEQSLDTLAHCGSCGTACTLARATATCSTGSCAIDTCDAGFDDCNSMDGDGCEADLSSDGAHCGMCGNACASGEVCSGGSCEDLGAVLQVSAGGSHSCGVRRSGEVVCWGSNSDGQLGDGGGGDSSTPVTVSGLTDAAQVSAGGRHTCAVRPGGQVACWGRNRDGQLGDGTRGSRDTPVMVTGLTDAVQVSAGADHTCAVRAGGQVVCWGGNGDGQLGDGSTSRSTSPVIVAGVADATEVAAGGAHSCAIRSMGRVSCWGANADGQLGDGSTTDSTTPVDVSGGLDAITDLSAGAAHTCAVRMDDSVHCWGDNSSSQVGRLGGDRTMPVSVFAISGAVAVAAGEGHSCALMSGGNAACWGLNSSGQLGDGTTGDSAFPTAVSRLGDGIGIAAGAAHTCAARTTGGVGCWGENGSGQVGDGTTTDRSEPTAVSGLP